MNDTTAPNAPRYRTRSIEVEAIHWTDNEAQVAAFLADNPLEWNAEPGDWIVRDTNGDYEVFTDEEFHAEFEPADTDWPELTWGEICIEHPQREQVRIPLTHGNTDAGVLVMDRKQVAVMVAMLQGLLDGSDAR